ncbi:perforin-1-like [Astyanax mexicanus]|uniref:Perforin-1-like n=1 Tax=Astyanax mexicanus TaxID=7994 RepID=A0A8T2KZM2_ASTMX|nr:perforin-1-like [Astyanax mexicanus]
MLQAVLFWVVLAAVLPPPTCQSCFQGKAAQCQKADFAPGSDLAGEGFDITKMQRKGAFVIDMSTWMTKNKTCTLCKNPYMEGKKQKLPRSVVDWRPSQKCSMKVSSSVYQTSESLLSSSTSSIDNNWKAGLGIDAVKGAGSLMLAGSNSKLAKYSMEKTKKDKFSFTSHSVSCGYYRYRVSGHPLVHPELKFELRKLPKRYDNKTKQSFYKLIDKFGTHYITKVTLGGAVHAVTSIQQCQAALQGLNVDEVKTCLSVEASVSVVGKVSSTSAYEHCRRFEEKSLQKKSFSSSFTDRLTDVIGGHTENAELLFSADKDPAAYKEWLSSLPKHPEILSYSLDSLHELLPKKKPMREHLRNAIKDYILQRGLLKNCSKPCKAGIKTDPKEPCICSCHNNKGVNCDCCPTRRGLAQIIVTAVRATGLWGDYFTSTDGYVKIVRNGKLIAQTSVIWNQNSPTWNWDFNLDIKDLSDFSSVRIEVWDRDNKWDDDLLGACVVQLKAGVKKDLCHLNHGVLYYKFQVTCIPSLSGSLCSEYVPSPISPELEKLYVSRHARRIPADMLLEMGVLLDERIFSFNQSHQFNSGLKTKSTVL